MDRVIEHLKGIGNFFNDTLLSGNVQIPGTGSETNDAVRQYIANENPWDRVWRLFTTNPDSTEPYPEVFASSLIVNLATLAAGSVAFALCAPMARHNFLRANSVTVYKTKFLAERQAMDAYMLGGLKKGLKYGVITYFILKPFVIIGQGLEHYRYKTSSANYAVSGAIVGAVSRSLISPKAMLAGLILGLYGGTVIGFITTRVLINSNITFEQRYYNEIKTKLDEDRYYKEYSDRVSKTLNASSESDGDNKNVQAVTNRQSNNS